MFFRRFARLPKRLQITFSLIFLVVLASIGVFIWLAWTGQIKPLAAPPGEASLSLQSDSASYNPGVSFTVYINLDTGGVEVSEVAIRSLNYSTSVLEVIDRDESADGVQIEPGSLGNLSVIENSVDTSSGKITYVSRANYGILGFDGSGRVAIVHFMAKASGTANLTFDFTSGTIGDTDVLTSSDGSDILTSAAAMSITISGEESHTVCSGQTCQTIAGAGANQCSSDADCQPKTYHYECFEPKQVCLKVSGAGTNECQTYADCLKPPSTPSPSPEPTPIETQPTEAPTEVGVETPAPTGEVMVSPSPSATPLALYSPTAYLTPQLSPETKVGGFAISRTWALILYIGVPVLITATVFLIWWWRKKKKGDWASSEKEESDLDDDELI